jgi:hypothetical protein
MQIIRTEVAHATAPTGQSIVRVLFCTEGGECVTVDMSAVDGAEDNEGAVSRAKAILVQTATFNSAANAYDSQSNGNFDEVAVTSAHDEHGDVYVFEYRDGETSRKIPPTRMPSFDAARAEAVRCAVDLLMDLQPGTDALTGWLVRVRDENGALLCAIDVQEAEAARQSSQ